MAQTDFTIADVLAWARTKPADEEYDYGNAHNCALCQFLRDTGRLKNPVVELAGYYGEDDGRIRMDGPKVEPEINRAAMASPHTFGSLVERLERLRPDLVVTSSNWAAIDAYLTDLEQVQA